MSENRRLLATTDWSRTPLGDPAQWPAAMARLVETIMNSGFPICTAWGDAGIQIYNDGYNAIYGNKHPRAFGSPLADSWTEIREFLEPALDQVRRTQSPMNFKDALLPLAKHGRSREYYFEFSYSAVCDEQGRTLGVMSIATETTAACIYRRRQESCELALASAEGGGFSGVAEELRTRLADNAMDAHLAVLFSVDRATGRPGDLAWAVRANNAQVSTLREAIAAVDVVDVREISLGQGFPEPGDCANSAVVVPLREDGGARMALLVLVPHVLVEPTGHLAFARSLRDRLHSVISPLQALDRVRRQMVEQDLLYQFLFENIAEPAIYARTDGRSDSGEWVLAANPAACRLLGYEVGELIGKSRDELVDPDDPGLLKALEERENERMFIGQLGFRRKGGEVLQLEVSSRLVRTEAGELRSVNLLRDISARLAREAERERRARQETIARLTGGFAHDFNNLLAVVAGSLELAHEALPARSPAQKHLATAQLCAEQGAALTGQLLSYARMQPLRLQPVDVNAHLHAIRDLLAATAGGSNTLDIRTTAGLPACRADEAQLTTAIINLVANARDAMPEGGRIDLGTETLVIETPGEALGAQVTPGRYVRLSVRDHGQGIEPAIRDRIFEPYVTSKGPAQGSGLGLAMVQGLARQCGGDVIARDAPGGGAQFDLLLPAIADEAVSHQTPPAATPAETLPPARILLVEDHPEVREILRQMLVSGGHEVVAADSGSRALAELGGRQGFDVLLTDLVMPGGVSGLTLAEEAGRRYPGMGVILITGHDPWGVTQASDGVEFEVLTKPVTRTRLLAAIRRARRG